MTREEYHEYHESKDEMRDKPIKVGSQNPEERGESEYWSEEEQEVE